jgi:hypothetical protein
VIESTGGYTYKSLLKSIEKERKKKTWKNDIWKLNSDILDHDPTSPKLNILSAAGSNLYCKCCHLIQV